ncbi:MAG TPA: hypothetical protein VGK74_02310 [Symbiobacteriaceae bacterium]|jgi:hypothetical protein
MAEKWLYVTMTDGSVWAVPAKMVAENRAAFYAERDTGRKSGEEYDRVFAEEAVFAMEDGYEITDWAAGNMNWSDVADKAKKVKDPPPPDFQESWVNGAKEVITE